MATSEAQIAVRAQAKGGKFLGDDIGGALVTIRDGQTGAILAGGVTGGDSGTLASAYGPGASQQVIVTPGSPPVVHWLVASPTTSSFQASLPLERPTLLEVSVYGPMGGLQSAHTVTSAQWVVPGQALTSPPGFVVELPGLLVQVLDPPTHTSLPQVPMPVPLEANVAMMCGCPINVGEPWIPTDFEVFADVGVVGSGESTRVPLAFAGRGPSLFVGCYEVTAPGYYQAVVTAIQKSTGNSGSGTVTFFMTPS